MRAPLQHKSASASVRSRSALVRKAMTPRSQANFDISGIPITPAIQPKLTISQPGDRSEQEADRIADRVMNMPEPVVQRQADEEDEEAMPKMIQRKDTEEEEEEVSAKLIQRQEAKEDEEETVSPKLIQRQAEAEEDEEERISPKAHSGGLTTASSDVAGSINAMRGGGQPLPDSTRAFFEPRFGRDFSTVRIHTDSRAGETSAAINAKAFTVGQDIAFGAGHYSPDSQRGQQLLAHELAHVLQGEGSGLKEGEGQVKGLVQSPPPSINDALGSAAILRFESYEHIRIVDEAEARTAKKKKGYYKVTATALYFHEKNKPRSLLLQHGENVYVEKVKRERWVWVIARGKRGYVSKEFLKKIRRSDAVPKTVIINKVSLTLGEINAMGDFFETPEQMLTVPWEKLKAIRDLLREQQGDPKSVDESKWDKITGGKYTDLAQKNIAHFGPSDNSLVPSARPSTINHKSEWEKWHKTALIESKKGDKNKALGINAFGDHFLTDAFAAGHLISKQDLMANFNTLLVKGSSSEFAKQVAAQAYQDSVVVEHCKKFETVETYGWVHLDIDSQSMFEKVLVNIHSKRPNLLPNAVVKSVHDRLNQESVEVENAKGDHWKLTGDGFLKPGSQTLTQVRRAIAQSQVNILNAVSTVKSIDFKALFRRVWDYTPSPTIQGKKTIKSAIKDLANPSNPKTIVAVGKIISKNIRFIMSKLKKLCHLKLIPETKKALKKRCAEPGKPRK